VTRYEKSAAQLDAEAQGRTVEHDDRSLPEMILVHRLLYSGDLFLERLVSDSPAVFVDQQTGTRSADAMSKLGPTLSYPLERYLSESYGTMFPWARGFRAMRDDCRRHHPEHQEREEFRGSLCHELVSRTVIGGYILDAACLEIGVTPARAGRTLRVALRYIEAHMTWQREKQQARAVNVGGFWPAPVYEHHAVPGLHEQDCHNPACKRRSDLDAA